MKLVDAIIEAKKLGLRHIRLDGISHSLNGHFTESEILDEGWYVLDFGHRFGEKDLRRAWDASAIKNHDRPQLLEELIEYLFKNAPAA